MIKQLNIERIKKKAEKMNKITIKVLSMVLLICVSVGLFGCQQKISPTSVPTENSVTQAKELEPVRIGLQQPLTGAQAGQGLAVKDAVELALDIINNSYPDLDFPFAKTAGLPNKNGQKIEAVWGDNKGSAQDAMSEAERLISENVVMLASANSSGLVAAASEVAEREGIPYINELGSSPALNKRGYKWYFAIHPDDDDFADMFFSFIDSVKKEGTTVETISIINMNTAFGFDGAAAIKDRAQKLGYKIVAELSYDNKTNNLTSEVQKLKAVDADVVMAFSYITDGVLIIKTMKDLDYSPKMFYGQGGFNEREVTQLLGSDSDYVLVRDLFTPELGTSNKAIKQISDMFFSRYGYNLNGNNGRAFQLMFVLADVMNRTTSYSREDIRKAIQETDIPAADLFMPWNGIKFDPLTGKNTLSQGIVTQIKDGKYYPVFPESIATAKVLPFVPWSKR
jgi:branched-chain amino acid transport system substrate-binding protein